MRDIAAAAGVDPALVIRHFGSKEQLFLATMRVQLAGAPFEGDIATLGERHIREVLNSDTQARGVFLALLRASDVGEVNLRLREVHEQSFVAPLLTRLSGPDAALRARLAAALVGGLLYALWVVGDEALAATDPEVLIREYGALLQVLIDG